jgi:hypothetical protein
MADCYAQNFIKDKEYEYEYVPNVWISLASDDVIGIAPMAHCGAYGLTDKKKGIYVKMRSPDLEIQLMTMAKNYGVISYLRYNNENVDLEFRFTNRGC